MPKFTNIFFACGIVFFANVVVADTFDQNQYASQVNEVNQDNQIATNNPDAPTPASTAPTQNNTVAPQINLDNQVTVSVPDRSPKALQSALQAAFSEEIVKQGGSADVMMQANVQNAAKNLAQYVQSYSYVELPNANPQSPPSLSLQVTFDQPSIKNLLNTTSQNSSQNNPLSENTIVMLVSGVNNISDYVQVMRAIRSQNDVLQVVANEVQTSEILLQVKIRGTVAQFQQILSNNSDFKLASDDTSQPVATLQYHWLGNQA